MSGEEQAPTGDQAGAPLGGRVAIVTGGATGIGFDICRRLLADGARLVLAGLTDADVSTALARLGEDAGQVTGFAWHAGQVMMWRTPWRSWSGRIPGFISGQILSVNGGSSMS